MRRAIIATALAGATTAGCMAVAGLGTVYSSTGDAHDEAGSDALLYGDDASTSDALHDGFGAADVTPTCTSFVCPDGGALLCDTFTGAALGAEWTPFDPDAGAYTALDPNAGCPRGSLDERSDADRDRGVYHGFGSLDILSIEADLYVDDVDPAGEGDFFKISVGSDYSLRLHYKNGQMYVTEVDNKLEPPNYDHAKPTPVKPHDWVRVKITLDTTNDKGSLFVDGAPIVNADPLGFSPPSGEMSADLSPRLRSGKPMRIHVDNVVIEGS